MINFQHLCMIIKNIPLKHWIKPINQVMLNGFWKLKMFCIWILFLNWTFVYKKDKRRSYNFTLNLFTFFDKNDALNLYAIRFVYNYRFIKLVKLEHMFIMLIIIKTYMYCILVILSTWRCDTFVQFRFILTSWPNEGFEKYFSANWWKYVSVCDLLYICFLKHM